MIIVITKHATEEELHKMAQDFDGLFIKVVVDLEKGILAGGGERHVDAEQLLLSQGAKQENLWGGGIDTETKSIDYNSMINIRPSDKNFSREITSEKTRQKFDGIVKKLLL